ncbi:MAG: hypothetical protein WCK82_00360 [Bacteroidota bacterium]|jgi:hypothetical protein
MKRYALKNKVGEIISYIKADSLFEAREMFANIKKIDTKSLLEIFIVEIV